MRAIHTESDISANLKSIIAAARCRLLFVARDMDADFIFRYVRFIPSNIEVSLLVGRNHLDTLLPAVEELAGGDDLRVRVTSCNDDDFSCGYIVVDDHAQYHCGGHSLVDHLLSHEQDPIYLMGAMQAVSKLVGIARAERMPVQG